jgi:hypothetical protein
MPKLRNRRRERFAVEIAAMTPLDRAYVAAGYADTFWGRYNASRLSNLPEVAERIKELQAEFQERSQIRAEYIQRKLLPLVEANAADLFEAQGNLFEGRERLKPITKLPRDLAAAVSKIKCDPESGRVTEVVLHSKIEAGNVLLRSIGVGKDDSAVNVAVSWETVIAQSMQPRLKEVMTGVPRSPEEPEATDAKLSTRRVRISELLPAKAGSS